jgi:hypothetical protein
VRAEAGDTWTYVCVSRHIINVRNTAPCSVESRRRPGHIASAAGATRRGHADAHTPAVRAATGVSVASLAASAIIAAAVHDAALTTCQLAGCSVLALLGCCLGAWWLAGRPAAGWRRRGPGSARAASAARVAAASPPPANARCRSSSARRAFGAARTAATCIASPLDHVAAAWAAAPLGRRRLPVSLPPRRPRPMITAVLVPPRTSSLALWPSPPSSLRWRAGDARVTAPTCGWVVVGSASRKQVCTRLEGPGLSGFPRT